MRGAIMTESNVSPTEEDILSLSKARERQQRTKECIDAFKTGMGTLDDALAAFKNFVTYCTADKRWFFSNGEPLKLPKNTQFIRLLPHIHGMSDTERLVICIYPAANNECASLQLALWKRAEGNSSISLNPTLKSVDFGAFSQLRLNELPNRVELQQPKVKGRTFVITLTYPEGQVEVTANETAIRDAYWIPLEQPETQRQERAGHGDMQPLLGITEHHDDHWRDDTLYAEHHRKYIQTADGEESTAKVKGADSSSDASDAGIWFCNNLARVYFWHPYPGLLRSVPLGGTVHDVLRIPVPQRYKDRSESVVIAPAGDGRIYLLGKCKSSDNINQSVVIHGYQSISQHIMRVIGDGGADILAIDTNQTIYPIHVAVEDSIENLKEWANLLVNAILERRDFSPRQWNLNELTHFGNVFFPIFTEQLLSISDEEIKHRANDPARWEILDITETFFSAYQQENDRDYIANLANTHNELLQYLWSWLQGQIPREENDQRGLTSTLHSLLSSLLFLPDVAPDVLWLSLFRHYPLIDKVFPKNQELFDKLRVKIAEYRQVFKESIQQIRPVQVIGSRYIQGQARHVRILDKEHICFVDYRYGLQVWKLSYETEEKWRLKNSWGQDSEDSWHGLPCSLAAGSSLNEALYGRNDGRQRILHTTNRGCIRLYEVDNLKPQRLWKKIDQEIRYIKPFNTECCHGLISGGANKNGQASLYWLYLDDASNPKYYELTTDEPSKNNEDSKGSFRMVEIRQIAEKTYLWAADQEGGRLYRWDVTATSSKDFRIDNRMTVLERQRNLYTLNVTPNLDSTREIYKNGKYTKPVPVLVCGGVNGQIFGIDPETSKIRWITGCGKTVKRIVYLDLLDRWLVCGEFGTVFIIDSRNGYITDLLENIGPISTSNSFQDISNNLSHLILSGKHGRLMLLEISSLELLKNNEYFDLLYPLRTNITLPLRTIPPPYRFFKEQEILIFSKIMSLTTYQPPFNEVAQIFLQNQTSPRLAWLLYQQSKESKSNTKDIQFFWELSKQRSDKRHDTPCQIVAALFRHPKFQISSEVRNKILGCIWSRGKDNTCPSKFWQESRMHGLRLGLVSWLYYLTWKENNKALIKSNKQFTETDPAFINNWLNRLWQWLPADMQTLEGFCIALNSLFAIHNSERLRIDKAWYKWLKNCTNENNNKSSEFPYGHIEKILHLTEIPFPLNEQNELENIFPSETWKTWIKTYINHLIIFNELTQQNKRILWKEYEQLNTLKLYLQDVQRLTDPESNLPLFALWNKQAQTIFNENLNHKIAHLTKTPLREYIIINHEAIWHNASEVDIHLSINNIFYRDLLLHKIELNNKNTEYSPPITIKISEPDDSPEKISILNFHSDIENTLNGNLVFYFKENETNHSHQLNSQIELSRSVKNFDLNPIWQTTWSRLEFLLKQYETTQEIFIWIDGHYWDNTERERLKELIKNQYRIDFEKDIHCVNSMGFALQLMNEKFPNAQLFCPDIPLSETNPATLTDAFHSALHETDVPLFQKWAFILWCQEQHNIPSAIKSRLERSIIRKTSINLMEKLGIIGDTQECLSTGIRSLPRKAIGNWCSGEPIHTGIAETNSNSYTTPYLHFSKEVWEAVSDINDSLLNTWFESNKAEQNLNPAFYWNNNDHIISEITKTLLGRTPLKIRNEYWKCPTNPNVLTLLDTDYECLFIFPNTDIYSKYTNNLPSSDDGRILCLIFTDTQFHNSLNKLSDPYQCKATCLYLPETLRISLALASQTEQLSLLNRFAATQLNIRPDLIFRTVGGMTDRGIKRHFHGRTTEIQKLVSMLQTDGKNYAIIGGRRLGKTSLRQYFEYYLRTKHKQALCISINCEGIGNDNTQSPEVWFANQLIIKIKQQGKIDDDFDKNLNLKPPLVALEEYLRHNRHSEKYTILIIDETEHLLLKDKQKSYPVLHWIRAMATENLIRFVITAYPHGKQTEDSIPVQIYNPQTPLYNSFEKIYLSSWTPSETWNFIHDKLQLLGIHLPLEMRLTVLELLRGIPWITHHFGQATCEYVKRGLVTNAHFNWIAANTRQEIENTFRQTIADVAETYDKENNNKEIQHNIMQKNLWIALEAVAKNHKMHSLKSKNNNWPANIKFSTEEVTKQFNIEISAKDMARVLEQFTNTGLLIGNPTDANSFEFANNLFPMIAIPRKYNYD